MLPEYAIRLAMRKQLVNLIRFGCLAVLAKHVCDAEYPTAVVLIKFQNCEVTIHGDA